MSSTSPYYQHEHAVKEASSDISSPQDAVVTGSSTVTPSSAPAKRGIRHLTPAQLAKKRANDRDSQRAIRERTKKQIETLENRVKELESGDAYKQLDAIIKEKEALQCENEDIRARLASALAMLQPTIDGRTGQFTARAPPHGAAETAQTHPSQVSQKQSQENVRARKDLEDSASVLDPMLLESDPADESKVTRYQVPTPSATYNSPVAPWSTGNENASYAEHQYSNGDPRESTSENSPVHPMVERLRPIQRAQNSPYQAISVPNSPLPWPFPVTPQDRPGTAAGVRHDDRSGIVHTQEDQQAAHTQLPNNIRPTCHFDSIIWDFTSDARKRLASGAALEDVVGPPDPDLTMYLFPTMSHNSSPITLLLMDILRTYSAIRKLPEKICVLMNMFTYLRWYIAPSVETYRAMPVSLRPVEAQVRIPHPVWVDMLPWPAMRNKMMHCYTSIPLDNFFVPYTVTFSVNWRGGEDPESCLYRPDGSPTVYLTPAIRRHWMHLENYSLGLDFARSIPLLADTCRIVDDEGLDVRT